MTDIVVCVGSSCHMKGSYQVIATFKELLKDHALEDKATIKASFCMGRCLSGIAVTVGDTPIDKVGFANAAEIFNTQVLPVLLKQQ